MSQAPVASIEFETDFDVLFRRLEGISALSQTGRDRLGALPVTVRSLPARTLIHAADERLNSCCFVVEGFTAKFTLMQDGGTPISAVQIPGDFPGLLNLFLPCSDFSLQTMTACRIGLVDRAALQAAVFPLPELTEALWRETLIDAAVFRTSAIRIGQLPAVSRVAHFLCEMRLRLGVIGEAEDDAFRLDLTQQDLGDALALSFVSVNRSLKELRTRGLVEVERPSVRILNWPGLQAVAQFNSTYLHLPAETAARPAVALA